MTDTMIAGAAERAEAAKSGRLASIEGSSRRQEFAAQMRAAKTEKDGKSFETLSGYASVVEAAYRMWDIFGEYDEVVDARAFDATLAKSPDVVYLINHTGMTMARTKSGTLRLKVDATGLDTEADLNPERSDVQDLMHAVRDGNVDEMSFAFQIVRGQWSPDYTEYRILEVNLDRGDVSAVNFGANPFTSMSARSLADAIDRLEGAPLRAAAERAQARLRSSDTETPAAVAVPVVASGPTAATLRARLELEN